MNKLRKKSFLLVLWMVLIFAWELTVQAEDDNTIKAGVFAEDIELSGKTQKEAEAAIEAYVEELQSVEIILQAANENEVVVSAGDLAVTWANPEIVDEAMELGRHGNVIQRYKALKDLEQENKGYNTHEPI